MQRIAVPMIGGMVSLTVVTLLVIPAIYAAERLSTRASEPGCASLLGERLLDDDLKDPRPESRRCSAGSDEHSRYPALASSKRATPLALLVDWVLSRSSLLQELEASVELTDHDYNLI
jgi:hypothetical protein